MDKEEILKQLNIIFKQVLDNENIEINEGTSAADVEDWDSLNHLQLVVAIEKHYHIRFTAAQVQDWDTVNDMINGITNKRSAVNS